jgi:hypothetical protein
VGVATVLYDTKVGDYAQLRPLTIVMKGESIPANSRWEGAPGRGAWTPGECSGIRPRVLPQPGDTCGRAKARPPEMKGESIPANSRWEGAPAVPVVHQAAAE